MEGFTRRSFLSKAAVAGTGLAVGVGLNETATAAVPSSVPGAVPGAAAGAFPGVFPAAEPTPATGNTAPASSGAHVKNVITINEVFADGQKVTNVVLEYDANMDPASLTPATYTVKDRTVTAVYTNSQAAKTTTSVVGPFVVIALEVQSPMLDDSQATDGRPKQATTLLSQEDTVVTLTTYEVPIDSAVVAQVKDVKTVGGATYAGSSTTYTTPSSDGPMGSANKQYLVINEFEGDHFWTDPTWRIVMHYNLFKPKGYSAGSKKKYPLVLFAADAGAVGKDWQIPMFQGNGGTVWATDEWQDTHPCWVVVVPYDDKFINDYWEFYGPTMHGTMNLVRHLVKTLPVDDKRVYTTGQSMGGMNSLVMMYHDPHLFTAAYCVASKWDPKPLLKIKNSKLLLLNAADDPGTKTMDQDVAAWTKAGAKITTLEFDGIAPAAQQQALIAPVLAQKKDITYLKIKAGTGKVDVKGNPEPGDHRYTWRLAYNLPLAKEWLFQQRKA